MKDWLKYLILTAISFGAYVGLDLLFSNGVVDWWMAIIVAVCVLIAEVYNDKVYVKKQAEKANKKSDK